MPVSTRALPCALALFLFPLLAVSPPKVKVIPDSNHRLTASLRSLALPQGTMSKSAVGANEREPEDEETAAGPVAAEQADPVVQQAPGADLATLPGLNLPGLGLGFTGPQGPFTFAWAPSDSNASVGATQVVEVVNVSLLVLDKATGTPTLGPVLMKSLWTGVNKSCASEGGTALIDPVVLYDKQAQRWVLEGATLNPPYYTCFAVSTTSDATGPYNAYAFALPQNGFTTPRFSIWPDGYYLSLYNTMANYVGPAACVVNRQQMIAGQAATMQCLSTPETSIGISGMMPSDMDGATPPPAGTPNYYMVEGPAGSNALYLYKFHVDYVTPANSTFTGPTAISVAPYTQGALGAIVPQLGTTQKLMAIGTWVMHRVAYRNFSTANPPHDSLVLTHTVSVGKKTGVRWYELRNLDTTPTVFQQGTYAPDSNYRWMASVAQDKMGDLAVGYSVSSATMYPSIRYSGRLVSDPLGTLETEATIFNGAAYQTGSIRWGDFTSMGLDPVDDCTFWYNNQYMGANGTYEWATRLFSFKFPACN